jgi:MoxR-like ATPase
VSHPLSTPFLVVATQNPVDMEGTYPLPEAQLDRFLMKIGLGQLSALDEVAVIQGHAVGRTVDRLRPVLSVEAVQRMCAHVATIRVSDELARYTVDLARATRNHPHVRFGASTRATLALVQAARARAFVYGRGYATAADIQHLVGPVFTHRLILAPQAELDGRRAEDIVREIVGRVPTPDTSGSRV